MYIYNIYTTFIYPATKKKIDQHPSMLYIQLPLSNTLRNFKFVYVKSDFVYLIFSQRFIFSRFFLDKRDY